ncbi:MAG TPA: DNA repair exonuclease [bacterium]|nr:DNA repair exonuclease [bacterium]
MKLLHFSDVHLGKAFQMLGAQGAIQRKALQDVFVRAVDLAIAHQVHVVLIAGDLFDSPRPSPVLVDLAARELRRLDDRGIWVSLVAGNHDAAADGFIGGSEVLREAGSRVVLFNRAVQSRAIPELDLTITGRSPEPGTPVSPLDGWPTKRATRFAVGVTHGSVYRAGQVEETGTIHPQEIRDLGLDYLALGDWHSPSEVAAAPAAAWYAGSPELLAYDQPGAGCVLLIDLPAPGHASVTPTRVGRRQYKRVAIDVGAVDEAGVHKAIEQGADPEAVCDVILTGVVPVDRVVDAPSLEREFADRFFRLRVQSSAHVWLDDDHLSHLPEDTVLGRFVRSMHARLAQAPPEQRPVLEEALQVGVALLQGREVLS